MYSSKQKILNDFSLGKFIIVFDKKREIEGDFFCLAENITAQKINFLLKYAKGLICTACDEKILDKLEIPLMVKNNKNPHGTNFCVSIDAKKNITTGISAADRAETIRLLTQKKTTKENFIIPGHTFPLKAQNDYKKRFGHTEASVYLAKKCNKIPVVVICEILNEEGEKASQKELLEISKKNNIPIIELQEILDLY